MATKEELLEKAKELDVSGRSTMSKDELEKAVSEAEGSSSGVGHDSEASDATNPDVQENLSPSGQEALENVGEDSAYAEESDLALDASGPLHFEDPSKRIMTGAVSEEHAKEQEKALKNKPEDFTGDVSEAGFDDDGRPVGANTLTPEPLELAQPVREDAEVKDTPQLGATYHQKAQMYTDGLSGAADTNLERAYEIPEILQSSDEEERKAGDESNSPALEEAKKEDAED